MIKKKAFYTSLAAIALASFSTTALAEETATFENLETFGATAVNLNDNVSSDDIRLQFETGDLSHLDGIWENAQQSEYWIKDGDMAELTGDGYGTLRYSGSSGDTFEFSANGFGVTYIPAGVAWSNESMPVDDSDTSRDRLVMGQGLLPSIKDVAYYRDSAPSQSQETLPFHETDEFSVYFTPRQGVATVLGNGVIYDSPNVDTATLTGTFNVGSQFDYDYIGYYLGREFVSFPDSTGGRSYVTIGYLGNPFERWLELASHQEETNKPTTPEEENTAIPTEAPVEDEKPEAVIDTPIEAPTTAPEVTEEPSAEKVVTEPVVTPEVREQPSVEEGSETAPSTEVPATEEEVSAIPDYAPEEDALPEYVFDPADFQDVLAPGKEAESKPTPTVKETTDKVVEKASKPQAGGDAAAAATGQAIQTAAANRSATGQASPTYSRVARATSEKTLPNTGEAGSVLTLLGLGLTTLGLVGRKRKRG